MICLNNSECIIFKNVCWKLQAKKILRFRFGRCALVWRVKRHLVGIEENKIIWKFLSYSGEIKMINSRQWKKFKSNY